MDPARARRLSVAPTKRPEPNWVTQVKGMVVKRALTTLRDPLSIVIQVWIPCAHVNQREECGCVAIDARWPGCAALCMLSTVSSDIPSNRLWCPCC